MLCLSDDEWASAALESPLRDGASAGGLTWSWCSLQKVSAQKNPRRLELRLFTDTNKHKHTVAPTWYVLSKLSYMNRVIRDVFPTAGKEKRRRDVLNERRELVSAVIPTVYKLDWRLCFLPRRPPLPRELITGFGGWPRGQQWQVPTTLRVPRTLMFPMNWWGN